MVALFLDSGEQPNLCDNYGFTALSLAAGAGRTDVVRQLIRRGANIDLDDAIGEAKQGHHDDVVRILRQAGAKESSPKDE